MEIDNSSGKTACVPYESRISYGNCWEIHGIGRGIHPKWGNLHHTLQLL